jgi:hypothetical protein
MKNDLVKAGAHIKAESKYLVPISGLPHKFESLKVYIEDLCKLPDIDQRFKEIESMLQYASDPKPITYEVLCFLTSEIKDKEPCSINQVYKA